MLVSSLFHFTPNRITPGSCVLSQQHAAASLRMSSQNSPALRVASTASHLRMSPTAGLRMAQAQPLSRSVQCQAMSGSEIPGSTAMRRDQYREPDFCMPTIDLEFDFTDKQKVQVTQRAHYERHVTTDLSRNAPLVLDLNSAQCELKSLQVNGKTVPYVQTENNVTIEARFLPKNKFDLEAVTQLQPHKNTTLAGLYGNGDLFSTQCEAEGFRNITCAQDRPDVLSRFTTTLISNPGDLPVKLSNGNDQGTSVNSAGQEVSCWSDPFPKPTYLFALVAGDLEQISDTFTTASGRDVALNIYAKADDIDKTSYAMQSLKKAMKWDEDTFGLEYDLDLFNIVSIDDFNMGAMENKGLNIFNSKLVLASPDTATDADYKNIERVVGHEYFHNWSGNRVTCQDWFQLSLKEGLTVYRDQEFSSDMNSRGVKRIQDVTSLRASQFVEDAGPMAHPVRPEEVTRFDNFYTATVYQKGAEVVRMIKTLVGDEGFRHGLDLYFARHDGTAATCDDFVKAMEDANSVDLTQFRRWYSQAGTPEVRVSELYDENEKTFHLVFKQSLQPAAAQTPREPMVIPMRFSMMDQIGQPLVKKNGEHERQVTLTRPRHHLKFANIQTQPILSVGRGFSAPVTVHQQTNVNDLLVQLRHDDDDFNRYEAAQRLMHLAIDDKIFAARDESKGQESLIGQRLGGALMALCRSDLDMALKAQLLAVPSVPALFATHKEASIDELVQARSSLRQDLAFTLRNELRQVCHSFLHEPADPKKLDQASMGLRSLKNASLDLLGTLNTTKDTKLAESLLFHSQNLTDRLGSLNMLVGQGKGERGIRQLDADSQQNPLLRLKYLALVASADAPNTLSRVKSLWRHMDITNPNSVYALLGGFMNNAFEAFHAKDGSGYDFSARCILEVDALNPQAASKMLRGFQMLPQLDAGRQALARSALKTMAHTSGLSVNTRELVAQLLADEGV